MTALKAREYIFQLLRALAALDGAKIVHRDVKPTNFLTNFDKKTFVLVDFGLAHLVPPPCRFRLDSLGRGSVPQTDAISDSGGGEVDAVAARGGG
jgi:serine/threonine protein kinase